MELQTIFLARYSLTDHAIDSPSKVDVPLPISSSKTREFDVAWFSIDAVSDISTINVDCPDDWSSTAPILVNIRSAIWIFALLAGIKLPIWDKICINPICLIKQLFPLALGPVSIINFCLLLNEISLDINWLSFNNCSTIGFLPPIIFVLCWSVELVTVSYTHLTLPTILLV